MFAVILGIVSFMPGVIFWSGRPRAALAAALTCCAAQFMCIMTWLLPQIALAASAIELAAHFNAAGRVPPRVRVLEDRIGSLLFYLDRPLRAGLEPGQIDRITWVEFAREPAGTAGDVVVIPAKRHRGAAAYFDLPRAASTVTGRYAIYDARQLWSVRRAIP